jgi:hypothetical protein
LFPIGFDFIGGDVDDDLLFLGFDVLFYAFLQEIGQLQLHSLCSLLFSKLCRGVFWRELQR